MTVIRKRFRNPFKTLKDFIVYNHNFFGVVVLGVVALAFWGMFAFVNWVNHQTSIEANRQNKKASLLYGDKKNCLNGQIGIIEQGKHYEDTNKKGVYHNIVAFKTESGTTVVCEIIGNNIDDLLTNGDKIRMTTGTRIMGELK
jgi:hypothetical protein